MSGFFEECRSLLDEGRGFVYAAVISKHGSAPSDVGARMVVLEDRTIGTVGGGASEADVISYARSVTFEDHRTVVRYYDLAPKAEGISDYLCGGGNEVMVKYMDPCDRETRELIEAACEACASMRRAWLIYSVESDCDRITDCRMAISVSGRGVFGSFKENDRVFRDMVENPIRLAVHGDSDCGTRYIVDPLSVTDRLIIFGGGHVSLETAKLATGLDFCVTIVDDREEYSNEQRFPGCTCITVSTFDEIPELETDESTYILVMTRGHMCDMQALRWALERRSHYIGMIGSVGKRDNMYERLRAEGITEETLRAVHCPVGLKLGAKTPAEIAVSIAAELISCRYKC